MENELLALIKPLLTTSPLALIAYFCYKSGILSTLSSRLKKNGDGSDSKKIDILNEFKTQMEQNHLHDLQEMKLEIKEIKELINNIDKRVVRLETKIFNGK